MSFLPTVRVKCGDDYAIINEADFNPEEHELYSEDRQIDPAAMKVEEIKAALTDLGIAIPDGALKADLQKLLADALGSGK